MERALNAPATAGVVDDWLRRWLDVIVAGAGLLLLSPLFALLSLLIVLDASGPVLYRARRVGKGGQPFDLYKFRSMITNADRQGPGITAASDHRITRLGRFLRRTKLDELPQLINVLRGEMSLVGPRPEDPRYVALYTPEQRRILAIRPGITSAASLSFRHEEQLLSGGDWEAIYCNEVMPAKLAIDLQYFAQHTLRSDVQLILRTMLAMLR